nr:MAG TPA: hypothetical protein [Caudoviricetes sp.]
MHDPSSQQSPSKQLISFHLVQLEFVNIQMPQRLYKYYQIKL